MKSGLKSKHLDAIIRVLSSNPKVERAILFGSRAMSTHTVTSDVDIALFGNALSLEDRANLAAEIDKLPVPQTIDLLRHHTIESEQLLQHIEQHGVEWYCRDAGGNKKTADEETISSRGKHKGVIS